MLLQYIYPFLLMHLIRGSTFPIAVILPLSGPFARVVDGITDVLQLAMEDVNQIFSAVDSTLQMSMQIYDSQGSINKGVESVFSAAKSGAVGIIGEYDGFQTIPIALAANNFSMWQCSGSTTASELSDKTNFPFFYRTISNETPNGIFMAQYINLMHLTSVSVMFTTDPHGIGVMSAFTNESRRLQIHIAAARPLNENDDTEYPVVLDAIKQAGTRVIVFMGRYTQLILLLRHARVRDMVGDDWLWLVSQGCAPVFLELADDKYNNEDRMNINGLLIAQTQDRDENSQEFISKMFLPRFPNRKDIQPSSLFYYDCFVTMGFGIYDLINRFGEESVLNRQYPPDLNITGLLTQFGGDLSFDSNRDRVVQFVVVNIYNMNYTQVYKLNPNATELITLNPPKFYSGTSDVPRSEIFDTLNIAYGSVAGTAAVATVSVIIALMSMTNLYLCLNRKSAPVKHMSFAFLSVISVGCAMAISSIVFWFDVPTTEICVLRYALNTMGNELVLSAVIAKSFRVWRIFNNTKIGFSLKNARLFAGCMLMIIIRLLVIIAWVAISPPQVQERKSIGYISTTETECRSIDTNVETNIRIFSYAYNGLLLSILLFLAYKTRKVMVEYRESLYIAYAVQIMSFGWLVMAAFEFTSGTESFQAGIYVKVLTTLICTTFTFANLVGRVAVEVLLNRQQTSIGLSSQLTSVRKSVKSFRHTRIHKATVSLHGNYYVKIAHSFFGSWCLYQISLIIDDGFLCLAKYNDNKLSPGVLVGLRSVHINFAPDGYPLCILFQFGTQRYFVQYTDPHDLNKWAIVLAKHGLLHRSDRNADELIEPL